MNNSAKKATIIKIPIALAVITLIVLLDQWTKHLARTNLMDSPYVIWDGVLELHYYENTGAVWGILQGQTFFLSIFTVIIMSALIYCYLKTPVLKKYYPLLCITVFIMGGAVGNLIDRVVNHYVTDFIYIKLINFPIFNVADVFVSISAVVMLVLAFTLYRDDEWAFLSWKHNLGKSEESED